ncbi:hypothetical protein ACS0TY_014318 [Phlomoides rotata]
MHRPMAAALIFIGINVVLIQTLEPVYDFVFFLPYWERSVDSGIHGGALVPKKSMFSSGIKALTDYVHSKGLKLEIYSNAGKKMPSSLGHEEIDVKSFASWVIIHFDISCACYCNL